jgi:hypothetical protein
VSDAPPPRLTTEQKAEAARLRGLGATPGLAADAAAGRIRVDDLERWLSEYQAARAAEAAKWATWTGS